jgi:hypothetical protein
LSQLSSGLRDTLRRFTVWDVLRSKLSHQ